MKRVGLSRSLLNLEKTSALSTLPTTFPRWGTLLTYGNALVIRIFCLPFSGKIIFGVAIASGFQLSRVRGGYGELGVLNAVVGLTHCFDKAEIVHSAPLKRAQG